MRRAVISSIQFVNLKMKVWSSLLLQVKGEKCTFLPLDCHVKRGTYINQSNRFLYLLNYQLEFLRYLQTIKQWFFFIPQMFEFAQHIQRCAGEREWRWAGHGREAVWRNSSIWLAENSISFLISIRHYHEEKTRIRQEWTKNVACQVSKQRDVFSGHHDISHT